MFDATGRNDVHIIFSAIGIIHDAGQHHLERRSLHHVPVDLSRQSRRIAMTPGKHVLAARLDLERNRKEKRVHRKTTESHFSPALS